MSSSIYEKIEVVFHLQNSQEILEEISSVALFAQLAYHFSF